MNAVPIERDRRRRCRSDRAVLAPWYPPEAKSVPKEGHSLSEPVLAIGDKLHVMTRRLFADDVQPHFVGEVAAVSGTMFKLRGYAFVFDTRSNSYLKHPALRTRVFSLTGAGHIVHVIPQEVALDALQYRVVNRRLEVTDGAGFSLEINEFGQSN
jgi:hypothetical protein